MLLRSHYFEADATSAIVGWPKIAAVTAGVLPLVSIGLVGAATIVLFAAASVSLLGIGKAPLTGSDVAVGTLNVTDTNIPAVPAPTYSPTSDTGRSLPAFLPRRVSTSEPPEAGSAKPGLELPSSDRGASTTTAETGGAVLMRGVPIKKTHSIEVSGPEAAAVEGRPIADEVSAIPDGSRPTVPSEILDEARGEVSHTVQIQQGQPANTDEDNLPTEQKVPAQKGQNQPVHRHLVSSNAAFRSRVQRECGSIIFPALRRHCVASFGTHYR
jgi:hypothetical protein